MANSNVIKSSDVAPAKKPTTKKVAVAKVVDGDKDGLVDDGKPTERPVGMAHMADTGDNVLIYFESGAGYVTQSGLKFSREQPFGELPFGEANLLLRLTNFRLPNDEEREMYYNNKEG